MTVEELIAKLKRMRLTSEVRFVINEKGIFRQAVINEATYSQNPFNPRKGVALLLETKEVGNGEKMKTYARPKQSGGIFLKSTDGDHIAVALKKSQKWDFTFSEKLGKYILSRQNIKLTIGNELFTTQFEIIEKGE